MSLNDPKIYGMPLHSQIETEVLRITRVPGGWLYETFLEFNSEVEITYYNPPVFVPWVSEFKDK